MRIATWNVNSVGARLPRLLAWLDNNRPDVLALQELKCTTADFPAAAVAELGYEVAAHGGGRWNGVALLSRVGLAEVSYDLPGQPGFPETEVEPRAVGATCGGLRVWSLYVPNGREPGHPHYEYKLAWFQALAAATTLELATSPQRPFALVGDFNVAPTDADVWDPAVFADSTHVTPAERAALARLLDLGLTDIKPRALKGEPYTFWDYRGGSFYKGQGMRIDLVYGNAAFAASVTDAYVDRDERKGTGASDHAPVVVDINV